jgi:hypothetical protein
MTGRLEPIGGERVAQFDDSGWDEYRLSQLAIVHGERYPVIPWAEVHRKPVSRAYALLHWRDTPKVCAERAQALVEACDDWSANRARERAA